MSKISALLAMSALAAALSGISDGSSEIASSAKVWGAVGLKAERTGAKVAMG